MVEAPFYRSLSRRVLSARKVYKCIRCDIPIAIGVRHVMDVHIIDGEFSYVRCHCDCWRRDFEDDLT